MDYKPQNGRGVARRRVLALMALTLPAACGNQPHPRMDGTGAAPGPAPTVAPTPSFTLRAGTASAAPPAGAKKKRKKQRGGPVPVRDGRAMLGSYLGLAGMSLTESLTLRRRQLGREQRIVHRYYSWADVPDREPEVSRDSVLMVSWRGTKLARINNGSSDRNIASVAGKLAGMKRPIMLRWGWEMNGEWFGWDGSHNGHDPAAYVRAWRRLHRIFREHGADNVAWVWSPNWNSRPAVAWNRLHRYYPGDDYVLPFGRAAVLRDRRRGSRRAQQGRVDQESVRLGEGHPGGRRGRLERHRHPAPQRTQLPAGHGRECARRLPGDGEQLPVLGLIAPDRPMSLAAAGWCV